MQTDPMPLVGSWALTYLLHSTLLLGAAWALTRRYFREPAVRDLLWKSALVGGLVTASLQLGWGFEPLGGAVRFPGVRPSPAGDPAGTVQAWTGMLGESVAPSGANDPAPLARPRPSAVFAAPTPTATQLPSTFGASRSGMSLWSGLVAAWLLVAAGWTGLYLVQRSRAIRRLGHRRAVTDRPLLEMLNQLRQTGGVVRHIRLTTAPGLTSPVALGGTEIVLPEVALSELDTAQQRSMLAHELAHLARRDPAWLAFACLLERALFLQPLNALARVRIQEAAEYLCDDWAVYRTGSGISLASCLVKVAEWVDVPRPVPLTGLAERRSQLVTRIHRLIEGRPMSTTPRTLWVLALAGALLGLTAVAAPGITPRASADLSLAGRESAELTQQPQDSLRNPVADAAKPAETADTNESWYRRLLREARAAQTRARFDARRALIEAKIAQTVPTPPLPPIPPMPPRVPAFAITPPTWAMAGGDRTVDTSNIAVPALILALKDAEVEVRRAAAQSLSNLRDPRAVPGLIEATRDSDAEVRASAVAALGEIGDRRAAAALGQALKDPAKDVKRAAFNALAEMPHEAVPDELVLGAMSDADAELRQAALSLAINRLDGTEDEDGVRHANPRYVTAFTKLLGDTDADIRATAAGALGEAGLHEAPAALLQAATDKSPDVREHVACALGEIRDVKSVPTLKGLLSDPNSDVREQAVSALSEIRDQSALEALVIALKSSDGVVRRRAAEALGQRGGD
jgi:HEAT repeat protein/beta-lactamase regulating signal transducer with metallopeptidase domain